MVVRPEPDSVLLQTWEKLQVAGAPVYQISQQELGTQQGELKSAAGLAGLPACCGFAPCKVYSLEEGGAGCYDASRYGPTASINYTIALPVSFVLVSC